jgi:hypothetical protein
MEPTFPAEGFIAGFHFGIAALIKFIQHKSNPPLFGDSDDGAISTQGNHGSSDVVGLVGDHHQHGLI